MWVLVQGGTPLLVFVLLLFFCAPLHAGKLGDTSDVVGSDTNDDDSSFCFLCFLFSGNDDDDDNDSYDDDDGLGPRIESESSFLRYPYGRGTSGYSIVYEARYEKVPAPDSKPGMNEYTEKLVSKKTVPGDMHVGDGKPLAFRASGAYRYDWDGVHLSDVRLSIDGASTLGVQMRWTEFYEPTDGKLDTLELFDLMLRYPIVTAHQGLFHLGVGGLILHFDENTKGGVYGALLIRLFPVRPLVMGADLHLGYLNEAVYLRGEVSVGVILGPMEVFGAYDTQMFLGEKDSVIYHGPGAGVRFWF